MIIFHTVLEIEDQKFTYGGDLLKEFEGGINIT